MITIFGENTQLNAADDLGVGFSTKANVTFTTSDVLSNDIDLDGDSLTVTSCDDSGTVGVVQY